MATAALVDISSLVTQTPGVYGGRPCLAGTRFPILLVAVLHNEGWTAERIAEEYGPLELASVYAGIAYYLANKARIDAEREEDLRLYEEGARQQRIEMGLE